MKPELARLSAMLLAPKRMLLLPKRRGALLLPAMVFFAGCDWLTGPGDPEEVTVTIDSEQVSSAQLITSLDFVLIEEESCVGQEGCPLVTYIITADTATVALPFERTYPLNERLQFHSRIYPTEEVVATIALSVKIDGRDWYDDFRELQVWDENGEREALVFSYQFQELTTGPQPGG